MSLSEMLTIMIMFHTFYAKNFKFFYKIYIQHIHRNDFFNILSYNRFVELMPTLFMPLTTLIHLLFGEKTGTYFVDSTVVKACNNKRRHSNKVFQGLAKNSKSSMGYFYSFKLHVIINENGEFIALKMTKGNVDDRVPVPELTKDLSGIIYADKGYIKQNLFINLYERGLTRILHDVSKKTSIPMVNKVVYGYY